jgi:NTP pyrophosphatase (non-canonical NTP hydrolase)
MKMPLRMAGGSRNGNCPKSLCFAFRSLRRLWKSTAPEIYYNIEGEEILYADGEACEKYERRKPEGVAVELADCMIRILDYCGRAGIDIEEAIRIKHEYNKTRPYRHGGKKC